LSITSVIYVAMTICATLVLSGIGTVFLRRPVRFAG
jgi:hypothetical protein